MTNINKILITVVVCVFMICVATVSVVKIVTTSDKTETTTQVDASFEESTSVLAESTTNAVDASLTSTQAYTDPSQTVSDSTTTTSPAAGSTAVTNDLQQQILGKWSDSLGMLGFEFYDDGTVNTTYFDLKQLIGLDLSGSTKLPYTLEGDILTIKFSAYTGSAQWKFRVSVNGNELTMYNLDERSTTTLTRVA